MTCDSRGKILQFKSPSVNFIGHKLTNKGVEPDPAKVAAITEMPTPTDKSGVQRFLGMYQYLSMFCHNLSETFLPLRDLTKEDSAFRGQTIMKMHLTRQLHYATTTQPFP